MLSDLTTLDGFCERYWHFYSLRRKRSRKVFRTFEAFFVFKPRENWGERKKVRDGGPPQFSAGQKSEKCIERAESLTETLATQANIFTDQRFLL